MVRPARRSVLGGGPPDATELGVLSGAGALTPEKPSAKEVKRAKAGRPSGRPAGALRARRRWPWITAAAVAAVALIVGGLALAVQAKLFTPSHPVPALVGHSVPQARLAVKADRFTVRTTGHAFSITLGPGLIVSQRPSPRSGGRPATAKEGSTIGVVVSTGPPPVAIPPLTSFTSCADAVAALKAVHLVGVCPPAAAQYSSTVVAGAVLGSVPAGTAPYGSTVTVSHLEGPRPGGHPDGHRVRDHLRLGRRRPHRRRVRARRRATPTARRCPPARSSAPPRSATAGPQPFGSKVSVVISLGPQPVIIPGVAGQSVAAATGALTALGLKVSGPYGPPGATKVLSTDPVAGTSVQPGTTVNLYTL